jgi:prephenate dehydrogenase
MPSQQNSTFLTLMSVFFSQIKKIEKTAPEVYQNIQTYSKKNNSQILQWCYFSSINVRKQLYNHKKSIVEGKII